MKFIEHRVADRRILRLIPDSEMAEAGVSEDGRWSETKVGTPQGAVASPLIANVYLHYIFDLWADPTGSVSGAGKWQRAISLSSAMLTILWWAFSS
jgi:retron-type reverse transcriptase